MSFDITLAPARILHSAAFITCFGGDRSRLLPPFLDTPDSQNSRGHAFPKQYMKIIINTFVNLDMPDYFGYTVSW